MPVPIMPAPDMQAPDMQAPNAQAVPQPHAGILASLSQDDQEGLKILDSAMLESGDQIDGKWYYNFM